MKQMNKQLFQQHRMPEQNFIQSSPLLSLFSVIGLIIFAVVAIPAFILFLTSLGDIKRYIYLSRM